MDPITIGIGQWGSSPHTRGALSRAWLRRRPGGIIPAYAGSTCAAPWASPRKTDHPRIRGEHPDCRQAGQSRDGIIPAYAGSTYGPDRLEALGEGSSPHTRGARRIPLRSDGRGGIIPAYAGSTRPPDDHDDETGDHPRIRGEHETDTTTSRLRAGSSPHTRGARPAPVHQHVPDGIIPAYAGSTFRRLAALARVRDHPRIRGEHSGQGQIAVGFDGSSPHTRGARRARRLPGGTPRIIPAYAGSTAWRRRPRIWPRDHPRIRGEHAPMRDIPVPIHGSSPHTRGAPPHGSWPDLLRRIIPAYAGSTDAGEAAGQALSDHPRIRGEHGDDPAGHVDLPGSSPHTRGARPARPAQVVSTRIIPAYAGSTPPRTGRRVGPADHPRIRGEHSGRRRPGG